MKAAMHRRSIAAALELCVISTPSIAFAQSDNIAPPLAAAVVVPALLLLGWIGSAMRRRRQRFETRIADSEAQLAYERRMRAIAERTLAEAHTDLGTIAAQQERVRQSERQRIARDIHDDLGQHLLAMKIELSLLQVSTTGLYPVINQKLGAIIDNLNLTIKSLRSIINDLRPIELEAGLRKAVAWQLDEFSRINRIHHVLDADSAAFEMGDDCERDAMVFRILQESLSNVARHAQATEVKVALRREAGELNMEIRDNGIGMPEHAPAEASGLQGIRDRVAAAGGKLRIDSQPGAGTALSLSIPLISPSPAH